MSEPSVKVEVHAERKFISASEAAKILKLNVENNRPINSERVEKYARDMSAGRWKENGDTIKITEENQLIDGQHRLMASCQAGVGFWTLIAYGVKHDAMLTIDRNQTRSVAQVLHMAYAVPDHNAVAGTLTWLWRFRDGIVLAARHPTAMEAAEILTEHPDIKDSVSEANKIYRKFKAGPRNVMAFCHYIFGRQDKDLRDLFFDSLANGAGLREIDPVFQLRERFIQAACSKNSRIDSHEACALYFKAWLAEREQRTMKVLKWMSTETFPNIGPLDGKARTVVDMKAAKRKKA